MKTNEKKEGRTEKRLPCGCAVLDDARTLRVEPCAAHSASFESFDSAAPADSAYRGAIVALYRETALAAANRTRAIVAARGL